MEDSESRDRSVVLLCDASSGWLLRVQWELKHFRYCQPAPANCEAPLHFHYRPACVAVPKPEPLLQKCALQPAAEGWELSTQAAQSWSEHRPMHRCQRPPYYAPQMPVPVAILQRVLMESDHESRLLLGAPFPHNACMLPPTRLQIH